MRVRVRRHRLSGRQRLIAFLVIGTVGLIVAVIIGRSNNAAGNIESSNNEKTTSPTGEGNGGATPPSVPCHTEPHTAEGAVATAIAGLRQLTLAKLGKTDFEQALATYVSPQTQTAARTFLTGSPTGAVVALIPGIANIDTTVAAWRTVSYTTTTAVVVVATDDVATDPTGQQTPSQSVLTATLTWNPLEDVWKLTIWGVTKTVTYQEVVAGGHLKAPCA